MNFFRECGNALHMERIMIYVKPTLLIGLSLSFCIEDLVRRRFDYWQVSKIVAGTDASNDQEWTELLEMYKKDHWSKWYPKDVTEWPRLTDRALKIANRFWAEGKLEQPRLISGKAPSWHGYKDRWVKSESEIKWWDPREG